MHVHNDGDTVPRKSLFMIFAIAVKVVPLQALQQSNAFCEEEIGFCRVKVSAKVQIVIILEYRLPFS